MTVTNHIERNDARPESRRGPRGLTHRLLLVSTDGALETLLIQRLEPEGFKITQLGSGQDGLQAVNEYTFDLIIIDRSLHDGDGIELCRMVRSSDRAIGIPIVMVSSLASEDDVITGLRSGADDYVIKPYRTRELLERLKVRVLRPPARFSGEILSQIRIRDMVIDPSCRMVSIGGVDRDVSPTEFKLLHYFALHPGIVYTRQQLIDVVKDRPRAIDERSINAHIKHLREKIAPYDGLIKTVFAVGYMFEIS